MKEKAFILLLLLAAGLFSVFGAWARYETGKSPLPNSIAAVLWFGSAFFVAKTKEVP